LGVRMEIMRLSTRNGEEKKMGPKTSAD